MRLNRAGLIWLPLGLLFAAGCLTSAEPTTVDIEGTVQAAVRAALPTVSPRATPDIEATVSARVSEEIEARETPTSTPTASPTPTATPSPTPTSTPSPVPPTPTFTPSAMVTPAPTPTLAEVIPDVGVDENVDLAVIKVGGPREFPVLILGDSDATGVAESVAAIGYPLGNLLLGTSSSVTTGIISSRRRPVQYGGVSYLQTNADINPGNSASGPSSTSGETSSALTPPESTLRVAGRSKE